MELCLRPSAYSAQLDSLLDMSLPVQELGKFIQSLPQHVAKSTFVKSPFGKTFTNIIESHTHIAKSTVSQKRRKRFRNPQNSPSQ
jgi:hypothetical protein